MNSFRIIILTFAIFWQGNCFAQDVTPTNGIDASFLYKRSAALLIGASNYQSKSWNTLNNVPKEIDAVAVALKRQQFDVLTLIDPKSDQLYFELRRFFARYRNSDDRLLIWFSGHGWTDPSGLGYLVPVDAPDRLINREEFEGKALSMTQVVALARDIHAKHAMFIFDSCFSGSVFMTRTTINPPTKLLVDDVSRPVRQFITAGNEQQEVPAISDFVPAFIDAIEGGADWNNDGYVSGSEIGSWIKKTLIGLGKQTPQYGTILDVQLRMGDMIFFPPAKTPLKVVRDSSFADGQSALDRGKIIARVDKVDITESDLVIAEGDIGQNIPAKDEQGKRDYLVNYLADMILLSKEAEARKVPDTAEFKRRIAFARNKALMEALLQDASKAAKTDANLRTVYADATKQMDAEQEVHARHILFRVDNPTNDAASRAAEAKVKAVIDRVKNGEDFGKLAGELTEDPSGKANGGDLGYFTKEQMVPEFAEVAFKLAKGQVSGPVKTQFGWHVLKVEDKRQRQAPAFDTVRDQVENFVERRAQVDLVTRLRADAKIERLDQPAEQPKPTEQPKK